MALSLAEEEAGLGMGRMIGQVLICLPVLAIEEGWRSIFAADSQQKLTRSSSDAYLELVELMSIQETVFVYVRYLEYPLQCLQTFRFQGLGGVSRLHVVCGQYSRVLWNRTEGL